MYRVDELITEIYADEIVEIPGTLTQEKKIRIEEQVFHKLANESVTKRKSFPKKKRYIMLLAATLVLVFGITVFAARKNEWDIALINFMGLNKTDTLQLDGGEVLINEVTTSMCKDYSERTEGEEKTVSITSIKSIGDKNSAYIRVDTDYILPKDFDTTTDYILPETSSVDIRYKNIWGIEKFQSYGTEFTAFYDDGKLGVLISIQNCDDLNKCKVSLKIKDLYWYHDLGHHEDTGETKPEELLCEGVWETSWTYAYKSNIQSRHMFKRIETNSGEVFVTKIEVSPISVRVEAIRNLKDREKEWKENLLEAIYYKNGTCIQAERSSGGIENGIFIDEFVDVVTLGEVIVPEEVDYLVICGKNVDK